MEYESDSDPLVVDAFEMVSKDLKKAPAELEAKGKIKTILMIFVLRSV